MTEDKTYNPILIFRDTVINKYFRGGGVAAFSEYFAAYFCFDAGPISRRSC